MQEMTVGELEAALFARFPFEDAEDWDQPGLSIGDRSVVVTRIAVNLDQSVEAVIAADEAGCNVLVTHHPPFIKAGPTEFGPAAQSETTGPGRMFYEAARRGVSVIAMHTNADRSLAVRRHFSELLGFELLGNAEHYPVSGQLFDEPGYGAVFEASKGMTLEHLAERCSEVFGGAPRVWGNPDRLIERVALHNGSVASFYKAAIAEHIDCVIVGETRYHECLDAQPHLAAIELGHDRSELPIVDVLRTTMLEMGFGEDVVVRLYCSDTNWWTPGTGN